MRTGRWLTGVAGLLLACGAADPPARADTVALAPRIIPVGKWAEGIAFDGSTLWVAESGQATIAQVDLEAGRVLRRISIGHLPTQTVYGSDGAVYSLVVTDKAVWQYFPGTPSGRLIQNLGGCPEAMTSSGQHVWVLNWDCSDSNNGRVVRIDPRTNERRTAPPNIATGKALASHAGRIWVTNAIGPALFAIDEQTLQPVPVTLDGMDVAAMAGSGPRLYAGGTLRSARTRGIVAAIDPGSLREVRRQILDQPIAAVRGDARHVVAVGERGRVYVFSAPDLELQRVIDMPGVPFSPQAGAGPRDVLILGERLLLSNGQQYGENGAVLVLSDWRPTSVATAQTAPSPAAPAPGSAPAPSAGSGAPPAPTATQPAGPAPGPTDCPYEVSVPADSTGIWMYQDPDTGAPHVTSLPPDARGLVADRCLSGWCRVTFRTYTGWVQRVHIKPVCG